MSFLIQSTVTLIQAHDSPLAALTFNASGSKLASASEKVNPVSTSFVSHLLFVSTSVTSFSSTGYCY